MPRASPDGISSSLPTAKTRKAILPGRDARDPESDGVTGRRSTLWLSTLMRTKFNAVKDSGGLVLAASNETDPERDLDYLLTGKILAEQRAQK